MYCSNAIGVVLACAWLVTGASRLLAREVSRPDLNLPHHSLDSHISSHFSMHDIGRIQLQIGSGAPITSAEEPILDFITGEVLFGVVTTPRVILFRISTTVGCGSVVS